VTREEIRTRAWHADTFVDFDQGLNFCIRQIREALGDNAESPQFIETLPRRGYRFVAPVESANMGRHGAPTRLIVLPFRLLRPDAETDFLAFSLPDALTSSLYGLESLVVRSSLAASRLGGDGLDPRKIGADADVDVIVAGTLFFVPETGSAISLGALGRQQEAISALRELEKKTSTRMRDFMVAARTLLEGDRARSVAAVNRIVASDFRDPEGLFYLSRHLSHLQEVTPALELFERVVEGGFLCFPR
jgi:hypothetical protein